MKSNAIYVWDPNPFNPYGTEVARVISEAVTLNVVQFTRKGRSFHEPKVRTLLVLPATTGGRKPRFHSMSYLFGLARFMFASIVVRPMVVFPWISNRWEAFSIRLLQVLKVRTVIVVHNPLPGRDDIDHIKHLRTARLNAQCQVVHTDELARNVVGTTEIAAHPAYGSWVASMRQRHDIFVPETSNVTSQRPSAVFIGSIRADKGFYQLPELAMQLEAQGLRLIVCVGVYAEADVADLRALPNVELVGDGSRYLSDDELYRTLLRSDVVVAPYREVTVSGSVLLAMSLGLPVVGFACQGFLGFLPQRSLVPSGDLVGLSIVARDTSTQNDRSTSTKTVVAQDEKSIRDWKRIIDQYA